VNPDHLFLGNQKENMADCIAKGRFVFRKPKTHCPNGHAYEGENIMIDNDGYRSCRTCKKARQKLLHARYYRLHATEIKAKVKAWKAARRASRG
jgi:hypothetical protein